MADLPAGFGQAFIDWATDQALPLWATTGWWNDRGCFYERLDLTGVPDEIAPLRLRTQARQIYVYAHAHVLGLGPDRLDLSKQALLSLRERAWGEGWAHVLTPAGQVQNPLRDAYDHAFVLHCLAWVHKATGEDWPLDWADETLAYMDRAFAAKGGGWAEDDAGTLPRRQNPHMHAFEAMLALYECSGREAYLARARDLFALFRARFFDAELGAVREFFAADWGHLPDGGSDKLEPGHLMEWVWLLRRYEQSTGEPVADMTAPLLANARGLGLDAASGFLIDGVWPDGRPHLPTRRLWVQTEYLKGLLVEYRALGDSALLEEASGVIDRMLTTYLAINPPGAWCDVYDGQGQPAAEHIPASTLYHLFGAVVESLKRT